MKKIALFWAIVWLTFSLGSCDLLTQQPSRVTAPDNLQDLMMVAREEIRESNIGVTAKIYRSGFFRNAVTQTGSGVIFFEDDTHYYALTNYHVIDKGEYTEADYTVTPLNHLDATAALVAELLLVDQAYDLAVVKFEKGDYTASIINIDARLTQALMQGELLLAVGNPSGINAIVTYGEFIRMTTIENVEFPVIHHTVMIYSGNSGGALTDLEGNLVGINTWGSSNDNSEGMAVPLEMIHEFLALSGFFDLFEDEEPTETPD